MQHSGLNPVGDLGTGTPPRTGTLLSSRVAWSRPLVAALVLVWAACCGLLGVAAGAENVPAATDAAAAEHKIDFAREILPVLARRCFACHGPDKAEGGLRLNSREGVLAALESGSHAVVPTDPAQSELLRRVSSSDDDEPHATQGKATYR